MSKLGKKIQIRACVFTFSVNLRFAIGHFTSQICREMKKKKAREGRAKCSLLICKICDVLATVAS